MPSLGNAENYIKARMAALTQQALSDSRPMGAFALGTRMRIVLKYPYQYLAAVTCLPIFGPAES